MRRGREKRREHEVSQVWVPRTWASWAQDWHFPFEGTVNVVYALNSC